MHIASRLHCHAVNKTKWKWNNDNRKKETKSSFTPTARAHEIRTFFKITCTATCLTHLLCSVHTCRTNVRARAHKLCRYNSLDQLHLPAWQIHASSHKHTHTHFLNFMPIQLKRSKKHSKQCCVHEPICALAKLFFLIFGFLCVVLQFYMMLCCSNKIWWQNYRMTKYQAEMVSVERPKKWLNDSHLIERTAKLISEGKSAHTECN